MNFETMAFVVYLMVFLVICGPTSMVIGTVGLIVGRKKKPGGVPAAVYWIILTVGLLVFIPSVLALFSLRQLPEAGPEMVITETMDERLVRNIAVPGEIVTKNGETYLFA